MRSRSPSAMTSRRKRRASVQNRTHGYTLVVYLDAGGPTIHHSPMNTIIDEVGFGRIYPHCSFVSIAPFTFGNLSKSRQCKAVNIGASENVSARISSTHNLGNKEGYSLFSTYVRS